MSNFLKYAPGADLAGAKVGHFWHFQPIPMSLKFNSHQFAFFNDQKTDHYKASKVNIGQQHVFNKKNIEKLDGVGPVEYRASINQLSHFVKKNIYDIGHITHDT